MLKGDARRIADALDALLNDHVRDGLGGWTLSTRARLLTRLTRHLPLDGAEKASEFAPPMWTVTVARKAGLPRDRAVALAVVGTTYFSTADLADDIADGDLTEDLDLHVTDVCRLTFLYQQAIARVPGLDDGQRHAIAETLARHGLDMADGQELDLRSTNALDSADPAIIARHKSGAEFAALAEMIAVAGGFDRAAWSAFGAAFGTGAQITSDYFDLFLDPESDDWATAKPTLPIRTALNDHGHRDAVHALLAGDRTDPDRQAAGLWHLVQAGAADGLRAMQADIDAELKQAGRAMGQPKVVRPMRAALSEIGGAIADALDEYRDDPRPPVAEVADGVGPCLERLTAFLDERRTAQAVGPFEQLIVDETGLDVGRVPPAADVGAWLDRIGDGARRDPARGDRPPDADATGRLIRLALATGHRDHPAVGRAAQALVDHSRRDGFVYTWLAPLRDVEAAELPGTVCPVAVAVALEALWSLDREAHGRRVIKGAALLARLLDEGPPRCRSAFYRRAVVEARIGRLLVMLRGETTRRQQALFDQALRASAARAAGLRGLDGRYGGDLLGTAVWADALLDLQRAGLALLPWPDAVTRALVDGQAADGGYPAERCLRLPEAGPEDPWRGARSLTAAFVHHLLTRSNVRHGD